METQPAGNNQSELHKEVGARRGQRLAFGMLDGRTVRMTGESSPALHQTRAPGCTFYLGTHEPSWLTRVQFPLCVSRRRLDRYRQLPIARCAWVLDSGAFSELSTYGRWTLTPEQYAAAVRRYNERIGRLVWAAPQDWMCEPEMVAKTRLSIDEHQRRTVENVVRLRQLVPDVPIIPVVQGWRLDDYLRCVDRYEDAGIDLTAELLVGIGSVCRRQGSAEIAEIVAALSGLGLRLHGFGVKTDGLRRYGASLASADSMAWSVHGRHARGCVHRRPGQQSVASEANCLHFARAWRRCLLGSLDCASQVEGGHPA